MPDTAGPSNRRHHLAILGAGSIGLEAALAAVDAGTPFTLHDAGQEPAAMTEVFAALRSAE